MSDTKDYIKKHEKILDIATKKENEMDDIIREIAESRITKDDKFTIVPDVKYHPIDKPKHYASNKVECIDYIRQQLSREQFTGYCEGNIIKYIHRYKDKNNIEDLEKAMWYVNKLIDILEGI